MRRSLAWHVLLPVGLGMLVMLLAVLQYRWLGQVSELERQELRHSLERRSQDFAAEVDNESGRLRVAFASLVDESDARLAVTVEKQLSAWRASTRYPGLIDALYVASANGPHRTVLKFDEARHVLSPIPAPTALAPVFDRLVFHVVESDRHDPKSFTRPATPDALSFIGRVPARLIWLPRKNVLPPTPGGRLGSSPAAEAIPRMPASDRLLIVTLNRRVMTETMLPAMLSHHFGDAPPAEPPTAGTPPARLPARLYERGLALRLEILDADNRPVFTSGLQPKELLPVDRADVTTALFASYPDTPNETRGDGRAKTAQRDSWRLLVQHGAGSLDQAVALTRRRNLYLSFGILSVLVVAIGLVAGNARRSERLAAQQMEFVATVSHELRTPIAVIRAAAENLSSGIVHEPAQAKQYGEVIDAEGRRLTDMVEHVLEHANIRANRSALRRVDVDVSALVRDTARAWEPMAARAGMAMDVEVAPDVPHLQADESALRLALVNLIGNAVKHAAAGRWIGITARVAPQDDAVKIVDRRRGTPAQIRPLPVIEVTVSDRGPGVSADERDRIFEAFYRGRLALDRRVQGSGLGLSLVRRIVEDHGGRIEVGVTPGGGATFSMRLPVLAAPAPRSAAVDA